MSNALAQFGFREVTPAEEEARKRRQAKCQHDVGDLKVVDHGSYVLILTSFADSATGRITVRCKSRGCGAEVHVASVTPLRALMMAANLRRNGRKHNLPNHFRLAAEWEAFAKSVTPTV